MHACVVGDETLIGMGAIIGRQCLIGARALVTQRAEIPDGSLVLGEPAKVARPLTAEERAQLKASADHYAFNAAYCLRHKIHLSAPLGTS